MSDGLFIFVRIIVNHLHIDIIIVVKGKIDYIIVENPAEKIELPYGSLYMFLSFHMNEKSNSIMSAKGVKIKLTV
jgi:hypothetical protein